MRIAFVVLGLLLVGSATAAEVKLVAGGTDSRLVAPFGVAFGADDLAYVVELTGGRLLAIDGKGALKVLGGKANTRGDAGDNGPVADAVFRDMHALLVGPDNLVYLADTGNNRVRIYDPKSGQVRTAFAGTGEKGFAGDGGPAIKAKFGNVYCLALGPRAETMYLADLDNRRIRAIDMKTGVVRTVAGNGQRGVPKDDAVAVDSPLVDPRAVAADDSGNVYVLERSGHALRVVNKDGKIRTVVGSGKAGLSGDGGDGRAATMNGPKHLCVDRDGAVLIADTENHVIRRWIPKCGTISRVAGTGKKGTAGVGGPPDKAELAQPHGVHVHPSGAIWIADSSNNRILKIE